jgi:DNA-binding transcriptional LysR family regulator
MTSIRGFDFNQLTALHALLEERNVTRAAERIQVTQSAMSGMLARLRRHFDDELLVRVGRGYELTPRAAELAPMVANALQSVERTLDPAPHFDATTSTREFALTVSDYVATELVSPLLAVLAQRAPHTRVVFDPLRLPHEALASQLERRDFVVGGLGLGIPGHRQILFRDRFVCIAAAGNPLARAGRLEPGALRTVQHAVPDFGPGTLTPADHALDQLGIQVSVGSRVPGLLPLPFTVTETDLVAFVPERLARRCMRSLDLVILDVDWKAPMLSEAAHWHPAKSAHPTMRWMRGILREVSALLDPTSGPGMDEPSSQVELGTGRSP